MFEVPRNLRQLRLKVDGYHDETFGDPPSLETMKTILSVFQDKVRHLTLIALNVHEQFSHFDQLQSLVQNFVHLDQFDYFIRTAYQPRPADIEFFPYIKQFPDLSYSLSNIIYAEQLSPYEKIEQDVRSRLTMKELYNSTQLNVNLVMDAPNTFDLQNAQFQLNNLRSLEFRILVDEGHDELFRFMQNVINLSPSLYSVALPMLVDTIYVIKQLRDLFSSERRMQITELHLCVMSGVWHDSRSTFWLELSNVLPNLRKLRLQESIIFIYQSVPTLLDFLRMIRRLFPKITHLKVEQLLLGDDENARTPLENFRKELDLNHQQHADELFPYHCTIKVDDAQGTRFDFWL